jgi:hypothetical protein
MRKHFRRKHSYAKREWKSPLHSKVFVSAVVGVFVGFILAATVFSGMLSIFSVQSPVFTISDGEGFTNLEVSDGAIASVTFQDGETIKIGNVGGTNLLIESPGKPVYEITQRSMTPEEEYSFVGKATITKPDPVPGNNPPNGYLDSAKCTYAGGWAKDPDTDDPIHVHLYFDPGTNQLVKQVTASLSRNDVGDHAFHFIYPKDVLMKVCDGKSHIVRAYALDNQDPVNGPNRELGKSPSTVTATCGYYKENGNRYACCGSDDQILDASGNCVEPGSGEHLKQFERYTSGTTIVNRVLSVSAYCNVYNMCVDKDNNCVSQWSAGKLSSSNINDKVAYCGGGSNPDAWIDCDYNEARCNKCNLLSGITTEWVIAGGPGIGEYGTGNGGDGVTECCGDDKDEYVTSYGLKTACCGSRNMILDNNGKCVPENTVVTCTDSDNGKKYEIKGHVEYNGVAYNDKCVAQKVEEFYCENNIKKSVVYDCGNLNKVCDGGKCVESTGPPETDSPPNGYLESADCTSVKGWAKDPDTDNSIAVHIYIDPGSNQIVKGTVANNYRSYLDNAGVGDGYHGFVYKYSKSVLKEICNGQKHTIRAYGINYPEDPYKNMELSDSPLTTLTCGYYKENNAGDYACCDSPDNILDNNGNCATEDSGSTSTTQGDNCRSSLCLGMMYDKSYEYCREGCDRQVSSRKLLCGNCKCKEICCDFYPNHADCNGGTEPIVSCPDEVCVKGAGDFGKICHEDCVWYCSKQKNNAMGTGDVKCKDCQCDTECGDYNLPRRKSKGDCYESGAASLESCKSICKGKRECACDHGTYSLSYYCDKSCEDEFEGKEETDPCNDKSKWFTDSSSKLTCMGGCLASNCQINCCNLCDKKPGDIPDACKCRDCTDWTDEGCNSVKCGDKKRLETRECPNKDCETERCVVDNNCDSKRDCSACFNEYFKDKIYSKSDGDDACEYCKDLGRCPDDKTCDYAEEGVKSFDDTCRICLNNLIAANSGDINKKPGYEGLDRDEMCYLCGMESGGVCRSDEICKKILEDILGEESGCSKPGTASTMSTTLGITTECCDEYTPCPPGKICNLFTNECESDMGGEGYCGDGRIDTGEECDDGNNWPGDGCSADCEIEWGECITDQDCVDMHGDDWLCANDGTCVSGNVGISVCPDGECDYPYEDAISCPEDCSGVMGCTTDWDCDGDKICVDGNCVDDVGSWECWTDSDCPWGEVCADGECIDDWGWGTCGDGYLDGDEECDDGNTWSGDGCSANCMIEDDGGMRGCWSDWDCSWDEKCEAGECVGDGGGDDGGDAGGGGGGGGSECREMLEAAGFSSEFAEWACENAD